MVINLNIFYSNPLKSLYIDITCLLLVSLWVISHLWKPVSVSVGVVTVQAVGAGHVWAVAPSDGSVRVGQAARFARHDSHDHGNQQSLNKPYYTDPSF